MLQPGAGFSFNESVTWRIPREELGYAPAFFDGQLLPAAGGGLCQASSTLYAAVLGAGLAVTGRRSHSRPVTYIALGLDATVSAPEGIDLTCRNDYAFPVMIEASARDGALAVAVRAPVARDREITLSPGAPFRDGRHLAVVVTRLVRRDGREAREIVSRDYYLWP